MNKKQLLQAAWKKAVKEGQLRIPVASAEAAGTLRFALYDAVKAHKKDPTLDPELTHARNNTVLKIETVEKAPGMGLEGLGVSHFVTLTHVSADPLMKSLAELLGTSISKETDFSDISEGESLSPDEASSLLSGLLKDEEEGPQ